jgi:hypothetical protein
MQESLSSAVVCIIVYSAVTHFVVGETGGNNVTFIGKSSNFSNANSWYEGDHAFLRDRFSPRDTILPPPDGKGPYCRHPAKCEHLSYTTCMGVKLPYASTTRDLVGDSSTQEQIQVCFFLYFLFIQQDLHRPVSLPLTYILNHHHFVSYWAPHNLCI